MKTLYTHTGKVRLAITHNIIIEIMDEQEYTARQHIHNVVNITFLCMCAVHTYRLLIEQNKKNRKMGEKI